MLLLLLLTLLIGAVRPETITLLARIGKTISHIQIDPVTLHLAESRILYKPIGEELQVSLAIDAKSQSGFFTLAQQLHRLPFNGSADTSTLTVGGVLDDTPTAIAYDWLTNKIYVAISTIGPDNSARIEVCDDVRGKKTDGSCAVILHDRLDYLHSLVLDPIDGNMYWINAVQNQIERAFMNGHHHDLYPFLNPASAEGATLTSLALSREASSLFYVRTIKDISELWQCRLYERLSCSLFFSTSHILHLAVHDKYIFMSLNNGHLAMCEYPNCEASFNEIEQISDVEVFEVVDAHVKQEDYANPCSINNGGCSHVCLIARIAPQRTCACPIGIKLKEDGVTCEEHFSEVLLISAITGLFYISLDTPDYTPQAIAYEGHEDSSHSLFDVDYDPVEGFIYWLDITDTAIKRCRFNGSDLSIVAKEGVQQSAKTIRLDKNGRNILWVDEETGLIWIGKMDGTLVPRILDVSIKLENPHGIAIDSAGGVMYITDWAEHSSRIVKMNLDGSEAAVFYDLQQYSYPTGVELDVEGGRLYWAESNHSLIRSIKLDATDLVSYMQTSYKLVQPYSVSKLGNRIFCNSMAGRSFVEIVLRDGILPGHSSSHVVESQIYGPVGLRAVRLNDSIAAKREGGCARENGGCQHYCVNSPPSSRCLCARGFELQQDGRKCERAEEYVIVLDGSMRKTDLVRMAIKGPRNSERLHLQGLAAVPHAIVYDESSSTVFIASTNDSVGTIESVNVTAPTPQATVVKSGVALKGISNMAIEPRAKLIVHTNTELGRIEVSSLDGRHTKTLAWNGLRPTIVQLDTTSRMIYFVNESIHGSAIYRMPLAVTPDGGETIYRTPATVVAVAVDELRGELYWTEQNKASNTLHKMQSTGGESTILSRTEDRRISHLQFSNDVLYYFDSKRSEWGYFNSSGYHSVHAGVKSVRAMLIVRPESKQGITNPCSARNGGCSELCLPQADGSARCECADHRHEDVGTRSCVADTHGIIVASNGRFMMVSARDSRAMMSKEHSPLTILSVDKVGLPLSIAIDELSRFTTLYWIDANEPKLIKSIATRGALTMPQSLNVVACSHLRTLTVDTYGRQLFVSCVAASGRSHILVFRIQSPHSLVPDKLLHMGRVVNGDEVSSVTGKYPVPTEMAVGARKLAYLDVSTRSGRPVLIICDLDGRHCNKGSERTQAHSRLSLLPRQSRLLYSGDDAINQLDLNTLNTSPISELDGVKALFTAVDANSVALVPIDEKEDSYLHLNSEQLLIPGQSRVSALAAFTASQFGHLERARSCFQPECTHLCSYTEDSYECLCPLGYTISHESAYNCLQNVTCEPWEFLCRDQRTCIHAGAKCDGRLNCPDKSDEAPELCNMVDATSWMCADGLTVIDRYLVCDGVTHCEDGSDESGCNCTSSQMDCAIFGRMNQPECQKRRSRCDHHYDCSNGADEDERLCSTYPPEVGGIRITFTHIMYGAIAFLLLLAICPVSLYFCYNKKRTERTESIAAPDRRYHPVCQNDPTVLVPLSQVPPPHEQYEMRAYSIVDSTSTYPSLPPPIASVCNSSIRENPYGPYGQYGRDHPSRFYAPPPSTASLSTYGIVVPSTHAGTLSHRRIVITEQHAVPTPSSRSGISPPPAYLRSQRSQLEAPPSSKNRSHSSSTPSRKQNSAPSRRESAESEHDSVSLSSHSSEGAPTNSRRDVI